MRGKNIFFFLLGVAISGQAYADQQPMPWPTAPTAGKKANTTHGSQDAVNLAGSMGNTLFNRLFNSINKPDWMTRTDISFNVQKYTKPVTSIETIQPIFRDQRNTLFWQGRIAYTDIVPTANLGIGYRYLTNNKKLMWGINSFYDQTLRYSHKRAGLGAEMFTQLFTFRANYYDALSGKRYVGTTTEQALNGYDFSVETPIPYISWVRLNAEGYHWQAKRNATSVNGTAVSFRIHPTNQLEINVGYAYDNSKETQGFFNLAYYLGSPAYVQYSATARKSDATYAPRDLEQMRLEKVRRHNDIVIQKERTSGQGIIIARGN